MHEYHEWYNTLTPGQPELVVPEAAYNKVANRDAYTANGAYDPFFRASTAAQRGSALGWEKMRQQYLNYKVLRSTIVVKFFPSKEGSDGWAPNSGQSAPALFYLRCGPTILDTMTSRTDAGLSDDYDVETTLGTYNLTEHNMFKKLDTAGEAMQFKIDQIGHLGDKPITLKMAYDKDRFFPKNWRSKYEDEKLKCSYNEIPDFNSAFGGSTGIGGTDPGYVPCVLFHVGCALIDDAYAVGNPQGDAITEIAYSVHMTYEVEWSNPKDLFGQFAIGTEADRT